MAIWSQMRRGNFEITTFDNDPRIRLEVSGQTIHYLTVEEAQWLRTALEYAGIDVRLALEEQAGQPDARAVAGEGEGDA